MFNDSMHLAILNNRIEFVSLFLENNFNMQTFLTHAELLRLYNEVKIDFILFNSFQVTFYEP